MRNTNNVLVFILVLLSGAIAAEQFVKFGTISLLSFIPMFCLSVIVIRSLNLSPPVWKKTLPLLLVGVGVTAFLELKFGLYKRYPFDERGPVTALSVLMLASCALLSLRIFLARRIKGSGFSPSFVWAVMGVGFLFLALDEKILIHEGLDRMLLAFFHLPSNHITTRLDDMIVMIYGVIAAAVLWKSRTELLKFRGYYTLVVIGFVPLVLHSFADVAGRSDFMSWALGAPVEEHLVLVVEMLEELCKLSAEAFFVTAFCTAVSKLTRV